MADYPAHGHATVHGQGGFALVKLNQHRGRSGGGMGRVKRKWEGGILEQGREGDRCFVSADKKWRWGQDPAVILALFPGYWARPKLLRFALLFEMAQI